MSSPQRMKKSVRKSVKKNVRKSVKKNVRKSVRKNVKKSVRTKRSYGFGVKVVFEGKSVPAREWQDKAFKQYLGSIRNLDGFGQTINPDYKVSLDGYTVFFNTDENGVSYYPARTVNRTISKTITEEVPDKTKPAVPIYMDYDVGDDVGKR